MFKIFLKNTLYNELRSERNLSYLPMTKVKQIKQHKDYYVTSDGNFYSFKKGVWKKLALNVGTKGYLQVSISLGQRSITKKLHRLVAETWLSNPRNYKEVNHKDGDKTNCSKDNLEWCTASQNIKHSYKVLNRKPSFGNLRLNKAEFLEIMYLHKSGMSNIKIGNKLGYSDVHIGRILKEQNKFKKLCLTM